MKYEYLLDCRKILRRLNNKRNLLSLKYYLLRSLHFERRIFCVSVYVKEVAVSMTICLLINNASCQISHLKYFSFYITSIGIQKMIGFLTCNLNIGLLDKGYTNIVGRILDINNKNISFYEKKCSWLNKTKDLRHKHELQMILIVTIIFLIQFPNMNPPCSTSERYC